MEAEKLEIWQGGVKLASKVYKITSSFPKSEMFGMVDQMRRAAVSIPSNIAEGKGRKTLKDFVHFLHIARGSVNELQTQCVIANEVGYLEDSFKRELINYCENLNHSISALIKHLESNN